MRSSSGSERSPAASAVLSTLPPPAQIVLQESDDDDDDDDVPVIVSTQKAVPPVITEPPPGYQAPRVLESQVSDLDSDEFEVELILNHRSSGTKKKPTMEYYVKWKGYPDSDNTWEPEDNFHEALIREYWSKQPSDSRRKKKRLSSLSSNPTDVYEQQEQEEDQSREVSEEITSTPKANGKRKTPQDSPPKSDSKRKSEQKSTPKKPKKRVRLSRGSASNGNVDDDGNNVSFNEDLTEVEPVRSEQVEDQSWQEAEEDEQKTALIKQVKERLLQHYKDRFHRWETVVERCVDMTRKDGHDDSFMSLLEFGEPDKYAKALRHLGIEVDDDTGANARIWVDNELANERCPQKIIKFYEAHIRFS